MQCDILLFYIFCLCLNTFSLNISTFCHTIYFIVFYIFCYCFSSYTFCHTIFLNCVMPVLNWTELNWTELNWTELNWNELNWTELNWTELSWTELNWTKLNCRIQLAMRVSQTRLTHMSGLVSSIVLLLSLCLSVYCQALKIRFSRGYVTNRIPRAALLSSEM